MQENDTPRSVLVWIQSIIAFIFLMIIVGGITRLTHSGLSMVEWRPLIGTLPPLNELEWLRVFTQYQASPEYQKVNLGMSLGEFKNIFFWEYFHRLIGRCTGIITLIPFLYFALRKKINRDLSKKILGGFFLGGLQGLLGWAMVKSGLVDRPSVSHFRLAAHLSLATVLLGYFYTLVLSLKSPSSQQSQSNSITKWVSLFIALIFLQINFGAFVAGLKAGFMYNTFPKMLDEWIPLSQFIHASLWQNLFSTPAGVQFLHRCLAYLIVIYTLFLSICFFKEAFDARIKKIVVWLLLLTLAQVLLGIATLLMVTPIIMASFHQGLAIVIFMVGLKLYKVIPGSGRDPSDCLN